MKMMSHARMCRDQINQFRNDLQRLDRTQAQSFEAGHLEYTANQFVQGCLRLKVAAICSQMNSRENDFLVAASHEIAHFRNCGFGSNAPAASANRRNDAEGTIGVAAVLYFYDRARASAGTDV